MPPFNVSRDHSGDAWFRLGKLDVTSTVLVVLIGAVGVVASAFAPVLYQVGRFVPAEVLQGQVWRAVTWPFVDGISLWSILTLVLLWYFGRDLENQVGRRPMMSLYVALWAILTVVAFVVGLAMGGGAMAGLQHPVHRPAAVDRRVPAAPVLLRHPRLGRRRGARGPAGAQLHRHP